jgi:hypothetical protein
MSRPASAEGAFGGERPSASEVGARAAKGGPGAHAARASVSVGTFGLDPGAPRPSLGVLAPVVLARCFRRARLRALVVPGLVLSSGLLSCLGSLVPSVQRWLRAGDGSLLWARPSRLGSSPRSMPLDVCGFFASNGTTRAGARRNA